MGFTKAVKHDAKGRIAIVGQSGGGKTMTALKLAEVLAGPGGKVALLDTEHGSASKYADLFDFDVMELDSFHPKAYMDAITEAAREGYAVIVLDSLTHAWNGKNGILEIVAKNGNGPQAWNNVKPIERALFDTIIAAPIHVIATVRAKQKVEVSTDEVTRKTTVTKLGLAAEQRGDIEYEFDIVLRMDIDNTCTVDKSRCPELSGQVIPKPGRETGEVIRKWLSGAPVPTPSPRQPAARPEPVVTFAPESASTASDEQASITTLPAFLAALNGINMTPAVAMERLGVKTFRGLDYDDAMRRLRPVEHASLRELPTGSVA